MEKKCLSDTGNDYPAHVETASLNHVQTGMILLQGSTESADEHNGIPVWHLRRTYTKSGIRGLFSSKYVFLCALFATMGGILFGYDQGVVSITLVMPQFLEEFPDVSPSAPGAGFKKGLMTAILELGAFIGNYCETMYYYIKGGLTSHRCSKSGLDRRQDIPQMEHIYCWLYLPPWCCSTDWSCLLCYVDRRTVYRRRWRGNVRPETSFRRPLPSF
jgi:hypothetical protein